MLTTPNSRAPVAAAGGGAGEGQRSLPPLIRLSDRSLWRFPAEINIPLLSDLIVTIDSG